MAEPVTTTFRELHKQHACQRGYRTLARALGGVKAYGRDTPIPVSRIVDTNGVRDALWVLGMETPESHKRPLDIYSSFWTKATRPYLSESNAKLLKGLCDGTIE